RAGGAHTRLGAGAPAPDGGAARSVRAEAHGRACVRGDRGGHRRDGRVAQNADAPRVRQAAGADEGASGMMGYHPLVKRLLDGELSLAELPPELRAEGEEALRLLGAVDRAPVALSPLLDERVMAAVRSHAAAPAAPAVDDGFGRRNSIVAVTAQGAHTL